LRLYFFSNSETGGFFCKVLIVRKLRQIGVIGLGLLGSSVSLAVLRNLSGVRTIGYSHRAVTRRRAKRMGVIGQVVDDPKKCVQGCDIVILATPISTFEDIFRQIADALPDGCIVTDVGSTKVQPNRWARKILPRGVHYVGSHPIAGSEQRGVEFGRDDLFYGSDCILTTTSRSNAQALRALKGFWSSLGCTVKIMAPAEHDRIFANLSHLPHVTAAAMMNASDRRELEYAGRGFADTTRVASGPANIWADILLTNTKNSCRAIDKIVRELTRLQRAIGSGNEKKVKQLLEQARSKRKLLIKYKMKSKETNL